MKILWSPEAVEDLASLRDFIAFDSPQSARVLALAILDAVEAHLSWYPESGRSGRVPGTREFVIPATPVIVPYRIHAGILEVLGVYHHARRWPERF